MYSLEFSSKKIVLAFNKDYFCLKCFFNIVDLLLIYDGTFGRLF